MKRKIWITGLTLLSLCGCSMNNTEKGLLGGAAVGTGLGAALGRGNPAAMALGAIAGTAVGGIVGSDQDRRDERKAIAQAQANAAAVAARNQMSVNEVVQLAQRNTSDDIIIRQMDSTGSVFNLTTNDLTYLQDQGVSGRVISAMQARRYPRAVVVQPGPVYVHPVPVYEPAPVVGVGIGVRGRF